jgi:hypothetical protein
MDVYEKWHIAGTFLSVIVRFCIYHWSPSFVKRTVNKYMCASEKVCHYPRMVTIRWKLISTYIKSIHLRS